MLSRFLLILLILAVAAPVRAQDDLFGGLSNAQASGGAAGHGTSGGQSGGGGFDITDGGKKVGGTHVAGDKIDFRMGRDNLGFPNLHGTISLGGMAGNCYAMAVTAKLFFERADFHPDVKTPDGFSLESLSQALTGGARFGVNNYPSLCGMSYEPGWGETEVFDHLAREKGLTPGGADPLTGRKLQVARLMQIVSTIHYLHYQQYQGGKFLEAVLRTKLAGTTQVQDITKREMDAIAGQLDSGRTAVMLLLETTHVYGHVVLVTRMTRAPDADYLEIYDSNVQYAGETRPSVMKVGKDGKVARYFIKETGGALTPNSIYDGDDWFANKDTLALILLGDESLGETSGAELAKKIASADTETAYLQASGTFLNELTLNSPQQTSLRDSVLKFVRGVQAVQSRLGHVDPAEQLPADADVAALNKVLAAHSDYAVRSQFPYALPHGFSLTNTSVQMDPNIADRATLTTTLTAEKDSQVDQLIGVLQRSAAMSNYPQLADWVKSVRERVGPTRVSAEVTLALQKVELSPGAKTHYGLEPYLQHSHLVIGNIAPSESLPVQHQIEVSEEALQGAVDTLLAKLGAVGYVWNFQYVLIPERRITYWPGRSFVFTHEQRRQGQLRFTKLTVDCQAPTIDYPSGSLVANVDGSAFVEVNPVRAGLGVNVSAHPVAARMSMDRPASAARSQWTVRSRLDAQLTVDDGTQNLLSRALALLADAAFPFFAGRLNTIIRERLAGFAELKVPFAIKSADVSIHALAVELSEGVLDLDLLSKHLFGILLPAELVSAAAKDDRIIIGANYR